ncbi:MAG TPA: CapA family protein [Geobacteraceae bacterium]|nr:CapA family protein [Geobacteraceae bacterium]
MVFSGALLASLALFCAASLPAQSGKVVLSVVGDIMLAGSASATLSREGYDYPFAATAHLLHKADIAVGNLEVPLAREGEEFSNKKFRFKADPRAASAIRKAGFTVVTLANNHIMDFGERGLHETMENLRREKILFTGAGGNLAEARKPALVKKKGVSVAFLAYSLTFPIEFYAKHDQPGTAPGCWSMFREDIRKAKSCADYVVVSFHWGAEGADSPKSYQTKVARGAIDAGADVVIGHHPHVLQGIERYRERLILYSLGNYAFGSMSKNAETSVMARIVLEHGVREVELYPLNVLNTEVRFQPTVLEGARGREVVSRLRNLSRQWDTDIVVEGLRYFVRMDGGQALVTGR